jgi:hypothetical protein
VAPRTSVSGIIVSTFERIIAFCSAAIGLIGADAADQVPYPAFRAVGGALIAFVPSSPS